MLEILHPHPAKELKQQHASGRSSCPGWAQISGFSTFPPVRSQFKSLQVKSSMMRSSHGTKMLDTLGCICWTTRVVATRNLQNITLATKQKESEEIIESSQISQDFLPCSVTGSEFNKYGVIMNDLFNSLVFLQCQAAFCVVTTLFPKSRNSSSSH